MLSPPVTLFDREMLFVTGKGGVGKSTVAAAIALAAGRSGLRTIVCELDGQTRVPAMLGAPAAEPGVEHPVAENIWATAIDDWGVLEEWIAHTLHSRALTGVLTHAGAFRAFAEAAPGGMELGATAKMWELAQERRWDRKRERYDLVVVDGPAAGHAVGMLRAPRTFAELARVGPIATQSARVRDWLADPGRTGIVAVALPEELPVSETLELGPKLDEAIGRRPEAVVVNALLPDRFTRRDLAAIERTGPEPALARAVRAAAHRAADQREQLDRLRAGIDVPVVELPFLFSDGLARADVETLADRLPVA